jgi:hypothetical protein
MIVIVIVGVIVTIIRQTDRRPMIIVVSAVCALDSDVSHRVLHASRATGGQPSSNGAGNRNRWPRSQRHEIGNEVTA